MSYIGWFAYGDSFDTRNALWNNDSSFAVSTRAQYSVFPQLYDEYSIPGRSGTLLIPRQKIDNISVTYEVAVSVNNALGHNSTSVEEIMLALQEQSIAVDGYQKLYDYTFPASFRLARLREIVSVDRIDEHGMAARFHVTFDCKPQRYLNSGVGFVSISSGGSIINPYRIDAVQDGAYYTAYPLIRMTAPANTAVNITVVDDDYPLPTQYGISIANDRFAVARAITIDTETGHAYDTNTGANLDGDVQIDEFPRDLVSPVSGKWTFTLQGVSTIMVQPRWWRL